LACKEFYPDVEVVGRYDAFWQEDPLRPMVGMNLNMPLYKEKRWAAVREARARVVQEQAALESRINEITFEVEQAHQRLAESRQSLLVYQERLLPTAKQSIDSARASYDAGSLDFLRLVNSQRESLSIQEDYFQAMAEYHKRLAELDRAVGTPPPAAIAHDFRTAAGD
jgi:outer membrane protein TolC